MGGLKINKLNFRTPILTTDAQQYSLLSTLILILFKSFKPSAISADILKISLF